MRNVRLLGIVITFLLLLGSTSEAATLTVCASGCNYRTVQAAVNAAKAGDVITLRAGETFVEVVDLPATQHTTPVLVTTSGSCPDRRLAESDAATYALPVIKGQYTNTPTVHGRGVKGWTFRCIRFEPSDTGTYYNVLEFGNDYSVTPYRNTDSITFDRIYIRPSIPTGKGIYATGSNYVLTKSHIANIYYIGGNETKAFLMEHGPGPATITDNYLSASSIGILFGGGAAPTPDYIPTNIVVENNTFWRDPAWRGRGMFVKNLFELKVCVRCTIRYNTFENNWGGEGQDGTGILFQPVNDQTGAPWQKITDVDFSFNKIVSARGITVLGYEWQQCCTSSQTARINIHSNLWVLEDRFALLMGEIDDVTLTHNTISNGMAGSWGTLIEIGFGDVHPPNEPQRPGKYAVDHLIIKNNLAYHGDYGVRSDTSGSATVNLENYTNSYVWSHNVIAGGAAGGYPPCSFTFSCHPDKSTFATQFADTTTFPLKDASPYKRAGDDGLDLGWLGMRAPSRAPTPPSSVAVK